MKSFKRVLLIVAILVFAFGVFACEERNQEVSGTMRLVVGGDNPVAYVVNLDEIEINNGVISILEYLKESEGLDYQVESSAYGDFIAKVGSIEQDVSMGKYVHIFTSVASDFDVSAYAVSLEYEGRTLTSSGLGASDMTIEDDCIIYFDLITF